MYDFRHYICIFDRLKFKLKLLIRRGSLGRKEKFLFSNFPVYACGDIFSTICLKTNYIINTNKKEEIRYRAINNLAILTIVLQLLPLRYRTFTFKHFIVLFI